MQQHEYSYLYQNDANNWISYIGNLGQVYYASDYFPSINMAWKKNSKSSGADIYYPKNNPPISEFRGKLTTTALGGNPNNSINYWEKTNTWENWGIPAGATVKSCTASYIYKWVLTKNSRRSYGNNLQIIGNGDFQTGPFVLTDNSDEHILQKIPIASNMPKCKDDSNSCGVLTNFSGVDTYNGSKIDINWENFDSNSKCQNTNLILEVLKILPIT